MEWVEAAGRTVDVAVEAALKELNLTSRDEAIIEVIQQPKAGFLGIGAQDAVVKVVRKPQEKTPTRKRRRRGGRRKGASGGEGGEAGLSPRASAPDEASRREERAPSRGKGGGRSERKEGRPERGGKGRTMSDSEQQPDDGPGRPTEEASIEERAEVAADFLRGLLGAFGLEGTVTTEISDDVLVIDVSGDQTEALVGPKGSVMQAVLEITRTVVQRKTFGAPRMRIDIAGYGERRREALRIYAGKLAERVIGEGGEVMLEPMNAADRKVIHDAVAEIDGVRSYSEGEDPERAVVIAPAGD